MQIVSLEVKNYRNHVHSIVNFNNGLNVLVGKNGAGKTNLLESIFFSSALHSPKTTKSGELVKFGEEKAVIKVIINKAHRRHSIAIQLDNKNKKKVLIDNIPILRAGELLGVLGVVFFSPDELKFVKEGPSERRRFLDLGLSQQQKSYFIALQRYDKILSQKNMFLKENRNNPNIDSEVDIWDCSLAKEGAIIIRKRLEYLEILNKEASKFHKALSKETESLTISYESGLSKDINLETLENDLYNAIVEAREKDKELGYSTIGPHRDDIKMVIDGLDARKYASQGQQRTIALSMKLGEVEIFKQEVGEYPVLLLDDVLSELDDSRQIILLDLIKGIQTILTCTGYKLNNKATIFTVENGTIV